MVIQKTSLFLIACILTACTTTPSSYQQNRTLAYTATGAGVGAVAAVLLDAPAALTILAGVTGAGVGYYMSLPEYQTKKIDKVGGNMYQMGDNITIIIPSDAVFEPATFRFAKGSDEVLSQVADVLQNYPTKNILVTSNTSGVSSPEFEKFLSLHQAKQVANFLWAHGISEETDGRHLNYAGLADHQPIADRSMAQGLAQNRRIQITLYNNPPKQQIDTNIGAG